MIKRFLWVTFQIFELSRENTDQGIRTVLESLPKGLHETYARILQRIKKEHKPDVARGIFQWLAVARRPLSLEEIAESTALEPARLTFDECYLPTNPLRLIEGCGNLVTHRIEDNSIQFAHSTVLEFLLSPPSGTTTSELLFTELEANLYVAKVCVVYLSFPDFQRQVSRIPEDRKVSATDMTVAGWVPTMVSGNRAGELMWNMARYCRMSVQSHTVTAASVLPSPVPASLANTMARKYILLDYVSTNWIYHCTRLSKADIAHWTMFEALVFDRILPVTHLPWRQAGKPPTIQTPIAGSNTVDFEELLDWAAENRHLALLTTVIIKLRTNGRTVVGIPRLRRIWADACSTGDVELVSILLSMNADVIAGLERVGQLSHINLVPICDLLTLMMHFLARGGTRFLHPIKATRSSS